MYLISAQRVLYSNECSAMSALLYVIYFRGKFAAFPTRILAVKCIINCTTEAVKI